MAAALVLLLSLCLLSAGALAQSGARVYELHNRPADDVASQIRALYKDSALTVVARGQQVVVRGEAQLLDEIGMLIGTLDVAAVQLRITVRSREDIGGKRSGASISGSEDRVNVNVERKVTSTNNARQRSLVVQDGHSAHVTSGQISTLPIVIQGGRNPAAILEQVETRSGFLVSPQVISDRAIELNIVSFEEDPASLPGYETEALVTVRRVEPGQWVSLGGTSTQASSQRSGITYSVSSSRGENRSFEVKVDILP
ncbi:secretin [Marinobacter sp. F4218]|nr:secretin [Marinobacter sp. F4218]